MILLIRVAILVLFVYFAYMLYEWWDNNYNPKVPCPHCEGEGTWEDTREEEPCILCQGSGVIEKQD